MHENKGRFWYALREHATHWVVGGILIAATGFAPEEWFARSVEHLHLSENALHLWNAGIDARVLPIAVGVAFIVGDVMRRRYRAQPATVLSPTVVAEALPLPDRPSIAVLPFVNLSGDSEQEYFSDGVADDIITELSRDRVLFVIARNSSFTYRGRSIDIKQIGRELGVRYVLEGSVRREAGRVRVTAQLIDASTDGHVWADRYDRVLEDTFAVQDEIAAAVANAIRPALGDAERRRILRKPPGKLTAWEEYQRGLWHLSHGTVEDTATARECFQGATEIDPGFAAAFAALAFTYVQDSIFHGVLAWDKAPPLIEASARRAVALDPNDSDAHASLAQGLMYSQDVSTAPDVRELVLPHADRAVALNRNSAWSRTVRGGVLLYGLGRIVDGRDELLTSLRLNPRDRTGPMAATALSGSYFFEHNYLAVVETARRYLSAYPDFAPMRRYLVAALGHLGKREEANRELQEFLRVAPHVLDAMIRHRPPYVHPKHQALLLEGFQKAGWQG